MKVKPRATHTRTVVKRITAPETRPDPITGKRIAMLSFIDGGSYQQHCPTTKDLFLYAAGSSEVGEVPDGLDRLLHHQFIVHKNEKGKAVGLDIVPSRLYRSGVVPKSQEGVTTLVIQYDLDGAVARVIQRPFNIRFDHSAAILRELDRLITAGKPIATSVRLGNLGRVVSTTENTVEVKLTNTASAQPTNNAQNAINTDDLSEEGDLSETGGGSAE